MTARRLAIAATLIVLCSHRSGAQQPARDSRPVAAAGNLALSGRVFAADGRTPLRRAIVRLTSSSIPKPRATRTDADGHYTFSGLPGSGSFSISAAKPQYLRLEYGQRRPFEPGRPLTLEGKSLSGVDFQLPRAAAISGTVLDASGEPLDQMWVFAFRRTFVDGRLVFRSARTAVTNDAGQYRLSGLAPGEYFVATRERAAAPTEFTDEPAGYPTTYYPGTADDRQAQPLRLAVGQEVVNLDLPLTAAGTVTVSGTVVDTTGKPAVYSTRVSLVESSMLGGGIVGGSLIHPENGRFVLHGVRPGAYQLAASHPQQGQAVLPIEVGEADLTGLTLVMGFGAALGGRVVSASGGPLPFAPATVDLSARPVADPQAVTGVSRGTVGQNWSVEWTALTGPRVIRATSLPTGWWLKAVMRGDRDVTDTPIALSHGDAVKDLTIVLDDKPTAITGGVTDAAGRAIGDCTVIAFAEDAALWGLETRFVRAVRPDHQNAIAIAGLPPGAYRIAAVDYVEQGQWLDPKYLESLRERATKVTLEGGEKVTVALRVIGGA